ncbi:hypothetical protein O3P69_005252 [Scylla paramamosain]|uniref:Uncharacterized protein n=1 Tax=Scylla paramamosain TaxID=85552 RepID=A0AAW0U8I1_SCYPA
MVSVLVREALLCPRVKVWPSQLPQLPSLISISPSFIKKRTRGEGRGAKAVLTYNKRAPEHYCLNEQHWDYNARHQRPFG